MYWIKYCKAVISYPANIKLIAVIVGIVYLCLSNNVLEVFGEGIITGLLTYGLLFYTIEAIKVLRDADSFKLKFKKVLLLPFLLTEPSALLIASIYIHSYYRSAAPAPGPRIAVLGLMLVPFFFIFIIINFFLNLFKYWDTHRFRHEPVKTGGLATKIFPFLADHIIKSAFLLSLPAAAITFMGIIIKEQYVSFHLLKRYPDMLPLMFVVLPFAFWLLIRLSRQIKPPFSVNVARLVASAIKDIREASRVETRGKFLEFLEQRNKVFKMWLNFLRLPSHLYREMAINNMYLKKYDLAIDYFREYLNRFNPAKLKLDRQLELVPFLSDRIIKRFMKHYRSFYKYEGLLDENFGHVEYLRPFKALENFEKDKNIDPDPELNFVYWLFLRMLGERFHDYFSLLPARKKKRFNEGLLTDKTRLQLQATINSILAHPEEYRRESLGESLNEVFAISNKKYFKDAFVLKGQSSRENLLKEWHNTEKLHAAAREFSRFLAPVPLDITEKAVPYQNRRIYVYTMIRNKGESVLDVVYRERRLEILDDVAEYLAVIHTRMSTDGFRTDFREKVNNKFNGLGIDNQTTRTVVESMTPVVNCFEDAVPVFGKDAHPKNWWVTENREIVALDMEDKGVVPLEIDLVNLLEFDSFGLDRTQREELKEHIICEYVNYYKQYSSGTVKEPFSRLRYLNAVIQRMFCLYTFWSSGNRDPLNRKKHFVLDNALYAINEISRRFIDYFSTYQQDYENLHMAVNGLKEGRREPSG